MGSSKIEMNKLGWFPLVFVAVFGHSVRCSPTSQASDPGEFRVDTVDGPVIGSIRQSNDGLPFASFEGIPFASPPVGDLRFAPPQPVKPWKDPLNLTGTFHGKCIQYGYYSAPEPVISGSEDCLYLNVWAPVKKTKELKAVMMWIYGGSLTGGSQNFFEYGPKKWMDHDVVFVSPLYRLGPFGFTSLGIEEAPGNQGFMDLVKALEWINSNIEAFGGDPNRVTVFGESSGSYALSYLCLTPTANGLFHRAILESGSLFNPYWIWQTQNDAIQLSDGLSKAINCSTTVSEDPHAALDCMRKASIKSLEDSITWGTKETYYIQKPFRPTGVIDGKFLPDHPVEMMKRGEYNHVDLMVGLNKDEGLLQAYQLELHPELYLGLAYYWNNIFGPYFLLGKGANYLTTDEDRAMAKELTHHYLGWLGPVNFNKAHFKQITDMMSDAYIWYGGHKQAEMAAAHGDTVYQYMFSFKGTRGFAEYFGLDNSKYGVCHADEMYYIWQPYWYQNMTFEKPEEELTSRRMTETWSNFAKYGDPSINREDIIWRTVTEDSHDMMIIDKEWAMGMPADYLARMGAWDEKYTYPDGDTIPPQSEMIEMGLPDYEASPELDAWSYYRNIF